MKAVDALTINDEFRLRRVITSYEDKLKNMPRIEQLQEQLASRIIEQDSIKKTVEKLQREKELQDQYIRKNETELKSVCELLDRVLNRVENYPGIRGRIFLKPEHQKFDVKSYIPKQASHIGMRCVTQQEIRPVKKTIV
jgi:hypothetical protein